MDETILFKSFLQSQLFALDSDPISNREKAEKLRSMMFFYHGLLSQKRISQETYNTLTLLISTEYSSVVDSMDDQHGLNNYNEILTSMTKDLKNDSQEWRSQLSCVEDRQPVCKKKVEKNVRINFSKLKFQKTGPVASSSNVPNQDKQLSLHNQTYGGQLHTNLYKNESQMPSSSKHDQVPIKLPSFSKQKVFTRPPPQVSNCENVPPQKVASTNFIERKQTKSIIYGNGNSTVRTINNDNEEFMDKRSTEQEVPQNNSDAPNPFQTAGERLIVHQKNKNNSSSISANNYGTKKRSLGTRSGANGKFIPPVSRYDDDNNNVASDHSYNRNSNNNNNSNKNETQLDPKYEGFEWMKNIDAKMIELIENEIMDHSPQISWDDIAGLEFAKTTIQEIVVWPMLRPDIFTGLRGPPKGLLLFGPPGTGKTLIGKCIASQSNATFFSISASSLTSKWVGEGEKMVRALFGVARCHQPAVIFIDEIDSLLTHRSDNEHESSRRIKTEFLVQLDGANCTSNERILVVGATNRPQELDEAARRRLVKRLYIPLPEIGARTQIVVNLLKNQSNEVSVDSLQVIAERSDGFSGADMANLCREAALGPIRTITDIRNINADDVRPVNIQDFEMALRHVRPSVSKNDLQVYVDWNSTYGSGGGEQ